MPGCAPFQWMPEQPPPSREAGASRRVVVVQHDSRWEGSALPPHPNPPPTTVESPAVPLGTQPTTQPAAAIAASPATTTPVVALAPTTQPIIVQGKLSLADVPTLQLAMPGKPVPIQLPPLTVTLSPDSPPIRVIVEHVAATQPAVSRVEQPVAMPAAVAPPAPQPAPSPPATQTAIAAQPLPTHVAPATPAPTPVQPPSPPQTTAATFDSSPPVASKQAGWGLTLLFLAWVLIAGALGGGLRYLVKNRERLKPDPASPLTPALSTGALVAFLAPIALGLVAPDLLSRARQHQADLLPALALCFVAGFLSDALCTRLRRQPANSAAPAETGNEILDALVETQVDLDSASSESADARLRQAAKSLDDEEQTVLRTMAKGPDRFRNERGLASRVEMDLETVQDVLADLQEQGYAVSLTAPRTGERLWYLTRQGRRLAATMYAM